ncbi:MAG: hypothetical protein JW991_05360 [Candidatus Pacebacteria bacterium]|nr:hypothetical protein [Candidatus Paceibacterota bacterium]
MQVSKKRIKKSFEEKAYQFLYQTIADIKNAREAEVFLKDLLTKTEHLAVIKRLSAAYLLKKGKNYREIKDSLKISSATISTIAEQLENGRGYQIALDKIQADEWAEKWSQKIKRMFSV